MANSTHTVMVDEIVLETYRYHPFAPVVIINEDNPHFIYKDEENPNGQFTVLPAFVMLAREEKAFWDNLMTLAEYAIDIVTTFSGVGNILKAGRLLKVLKAGKTLILRSSQATKTITVIKAFAGGVEITSGVGNGLLKLTGTRDTELGRAISEVLFYLEMGALAGELTVALSISIKKASQKALENTTEVNKIIKQAQETLLKNTDEAGNPKQIEEVLKAQDDLAAIKQLEEFAGISNIAKNLDSVKLTRLGLDEWKKVISQSGGKVRHVSESEKMGKHFLTENVGAAFDPFEIPPTIWIREAPSDLELFHEAMHFEDYLRRGDANFKRGFEKEILPFGNKPQPSKRDMLISDYIKEKYVLDRVLEEQQNWIDKFGVGRFTEQEIEFSVAYFTGYELDCISAGIDVSKIIIKPI